MKGIEVKKSLATMANIKMRRLCRPTFSPKYASSFNMNPNKWMLVNFDCSLMWVKDRYKLTQALVVDPLYLQHSYSECAIDYRVRLIVLTKHPPASPISFLFLS